MEKLMMGDCLQLMNDIPDGSVDMICADLPYGTTNCRWDTVIPFEPLWAQYKRVIKKNGAIVLTASQPFTSALVMSNAEWFKYAWVWEKTIATGFNHCKNAPLKNHEDVLVFSKGSIAHANLSVNRMNYFPQGLTKVDRENKRGSKGFEGSMERKSQSNHYITEFTGYPRSVLKFPNEGKTVHPTQKPVALMEYLIKTYTNPGDTVLDNVMGSGTTGVACKNLGRNFIGIEKDETYFNIAKARIESVCPPIQTSKTL